MSDESGPATYLSLDESHRPVKLRKVVLGFPCNSTQTEFKFDLSLNYKMANIIQTYSDQKPALVVGAKLQHLYVFVHVFDLCQKYLMPRDNIIKFHKWLKVGRMLLKFFTVSKLCCPKVLQHTERSTAVSCCSGQGCKVHNEHWA